MWRDLADKAFRARTTEQVDSEHLHDEQTPDHRRLRQHNFPVAIRVERITVMIGMAQQVFLVIEHVNERKKVEKEPVQPLCLENRAVDEFVASGPEET